MPLAAAAQRSSHVQLPDLVRRVPLPDRRQLPVHRQPGHPVHRAQQEVPVDSAPTTSPICVLAAAQVVDLEPDLDRQAGVARRRDGGVVAAEVVHRVGRHSGWSNQSRATAKR